MAAVLSTHEVCIQTSVLILQNKSVTIPTFVVCNSQHTHTKPTKNTTHMCTQKRRLFIASNFPLACVSVCLRVCLCVYLSAYLSDLSACLPTCLHVWLSAADLSVRPSLCLFLCQSVHLVCLLRLCLSACLPALPMSAFFYVCVWQTSSLFNNLFTQQVLDLFFTTHWF